MTDIGQIMAECDCQHSACWDRKYCMAAKVDSLTAKLATWEKYRDAYDKMGRIGTEAYRDLEAKLAKAVEAERARIVKILDGIDRTELDDNGWWETSFGEKFGASVLAAIMKGEGRD